jgi:hypothetical protein
MFLPRYERTRGIEERFGLTRYIATMVRRNVYDSLKSKMNSTHASFASTT